jgi:hypothetical protein
VSDEAGSMRREGVLTCFKVQSHDCSVLRNAVNMCIVMSVLREENKNEPF